MSWALHALAIGLLWGPAGRWVGDSLAALRLEDHPRRGGAPGAGTRIGQAERVLVYLALVGGQPGLVAVVLGLKTLVRYPEVRVAAERDASAPDGEPGAEPVVRGQRFAEYYLVGTLLSVLCAVAVALIVETLLGQG